MAVAFVFAGQGAQYTGMGCDLYESSRAARDVFDATTKISFTATNEELAVTINTQPAMLAMDLACAAVLTENGIRADMAAGFSLGEIAALSYAGAMSTAESFELITHRATFMHDCKRGGMTAVLKLPNEQVNEIASKFENVYPVNYNCPGQVAVAGLELDAFSNEVINAGGRVIKLNVSGAFHSPLMAEASDKLAKVLGNFDSLNIPVYSNYTSLPYTNHVAHYIIQQVKNPVLWEPTINNMIADGADVFIEVGAGKVLSGFIRRINKTVLVLNMEKYEDINFINQELEKYREHIKTWR